MPAEPARHSVAAMKRLLILLLLALLLLVLALGGWAVEGARWAVQGRRARLSPA